MYVWIVVDLETGEPASFDESLSEEEVISKTKEGLGVDDAYIKESMLVRKVRVER